MIGQLLLLLLLPFLFIVGLLYPIYVVARFRILSQRGDGAFAQTFEGLYLRFATLATILSYVGFVLVFTRPAFVPSFTRFVEGGGLAIMVPCLLLDFLLANVLTRERALRRFQARQQKGA
ncbi:MAG: hypothetical protein H6727_17010 [Myxococcales bacterium]|nr:hypothetical protein [Myxococcales bacterium]